MQKKEETSKEDFDGFLSHRIENLMKEDFDWYQNKMLCSLIQACGRGIRSHKDHCITYILDAAIVESIVKNRHKLPKYYLDRFA